MYKFMQVVGSAGSVEQGAEEAAEEVEAAAEVEAEAEAEAAAEVEAAAALAGGFPPAEGVAGATALGDVAGAAALMTVAA